MHNLVVGEMYRAMKYAQREVAPCQVERPRINTFYDIEGDACDVEQQGHLQQVHVVSIGNADVRGHILRLSVLKVVSDYLPSERGLEAPVRNDQKDRKSQHGQRCHWVQNICLVHSCAARPSAQRSR